MMATPRPSSVTRRTGISTLFDQRFDEAAQLTATNGAFRRRLGALCAAQVPILRF
jgi:hypothetical protein